MSTRLGEVFASSVIWKVRVKSRLSLKHQVQIVNSIQIKFQRGISTVFHYVTRSCWTIQWREIVLADTGALCDFHFFYVAVSTPQESFNFNLKYLSEKREKYSSLIGEKGYPLPPPPLKSNETEQPGIEVGFSTSKGRGTCLTGITSLTHTQSCCPKKKKKKPYRLFFCPWA